MNLFNLYKKHKKIFSSVQTCGEECNTMRFYGFSIVKSGDIIMWDFVRIQIQLNLHHNAAYEEGED